MRVWIVCGLLATCAHVDKKSTSPAPDKISEEKLRSVIPSSIKGIGISNVHLVARSKGVLYRGMRPISIGAVENLRHQLGVTDVLIFRESSKDVGVEQEIAMLNEVGISKDHIHYLPMKWKEIHDFKAACTLTIRALRLFQQILETKKAALFAHCTVGEDRTGYIFGLYRILFESRAIDEVFKNEMCEMGYAEGNPAKPKAVNALIHQNITPLFLKINYLIEKKKLTVDNLSIDACTKDPLLEDPLFKSEFRLRLAQLRCTPSTRVMDL